MSVLGLRSALIQRKQRQRLHFAGALWCLFLHEQHRMTRSIWTRTWISRSEELGAFETLISELREEDKCSYLNFLRMTPNIFDELLVKVAPLIEKQNTNYRRAILAAKRLAMTLRYLATEETFVSLAFLFRVGNNTLGQIVPETCQVIHAVLEQDYLKCPSTPEEWELVASEYENLWDFPNCIGAINGKHIAIRKPACSGSDYFNYKHCFSIVLLALVDAHYRFLFCNIGAQGCCSDAGIFLESDLNDALLQNTIGMPASKSLPGRPATDTFPYCIMADDAFPLRHNIMKPFPHRGLTRRERIFNYRLSRARRCSEQAFGIMSARFRVLLSPMCIRPDKVDKVVMATCVLHNMLRSLAPSTYVQCIQELESDKPTLGKAQVSGRRSAMKTAKEYREHLCTYFNSEEGAVPWQGSMI